MRTEALQIFKAAIEDLSPPNLQTNPKALPTAPARKVDRLLRITRGPLESEKAGMSPTKATHAFENLRKFMKI